MSVFKPFIILLILTFLGTRAFSQYPGCPQINAGNDQSTTCNNPCVNLAATVLQTGQTNSYTVSSIPYAPPFSYSGGTPVSVNVDDVWSNIINLPFTFCFYGNAYNQVLVGSNGVITFDLTDASGYCPWSYTDPIPSPNLILNAIFGAYHDIDPSVAGNIYYDITGSYPCRTFVFKFNNVAHFSCNSIYTTQQIVLYEGTNVIEVYIQDKPTCATWNSGNALIGIQDATGTVGITPPGRNTGPWTANSEAWRFTPSGAPNYTVQWYEAGLPIATGLTTTVCPTATTTYTAEVTYNNCSGGQIIAQDQVVVNVSLSAYAGPDDTTCNMSYTLGAVSSGAGTWTYSGPGTATFNDNTDPNAIVTVSASGVYTFTWTTGSGANQCVDAVVITFSQIPVANAGADDAVCSLSYQMNAVPSVGSGLWTVTGPGTITFTDSQNPNTNVTASVGGTYIFTWTESNGSNCSSSDVVNITFTEMPVADAGTDINVCQLSVNLAATPSVGTGTWSLVSGAGLTIASPNNPSSAVSTLNPTGTYVLEWTEDNANGCISSDQVQVVLTQTPVATAGPDNAVCTLAYQFNATPSVGTGLWTGAGPGTINIANSGNPASQVSVSANGIYTFTWTEDNGNGCTSSDQVSITFTQMPAANAGNDITVCQLNTALQAVPSVGNGTWTQTSGPGVLSFADATIPNTDVSSFTPGAYSVTWTEDNGNGCISSDNMILTLTQMPLSNAGIRDSICSLTYNLSAAPSVGNGTWIQFSGQGFASFQNVNSAASAVSVTTYGDYEFIWTENNGNGCIDSDTVLITFNYIPTSNFTVSPLNCFSDTITITYTGNGELTAAYNWAFNGANVISGASYGPYTINYPATGNYLISLTVSQHGCVSVLNTVNNFNPPLLTLSLVKTDISCNGLSDGKIYTLVSGGTEPYYYLWNPLSAAPNMLNITPGTYLVTVTDFNGCTQTDFTVVNEPPKLVNSIPSYSAICKDSVLNIVSSVTGGVTPYNYMWNTGSINPFIDVSPDTTTQYYIVTTDANGCTAISNITVFVYPPVNITASSSVDSICPGEMVVISASATGGNGNYSYTLDGTPGSPPFIVFPSQSVHTYIINVKDGCSYTDNHSIPIGVYPSPPNNPVSDIYQGCAPLAVQFNEQSPGNLTYYWDFGDDEAAFVKNPLHVYKKEGTFDVTVITTNIYGCKTLNIIPQWITVFPLPDAKYVTDPEPARTSILKPVVKFENLSSLAETSNWYFGDGDSSDVHSPFHRYPTYPSGVYDVTLIVTSSRGCKDTVYGLVEVYEIMTFYAPNAFSPDNDNINPEFRVFATGIIEGTFTMNIYNRWGELIFTSTDIEKGWDGKVKGGREATTDVYTWLVTFRDFKKVLHEKAGQITLIR